MASEAEIAQGELLRASLLRNKALKDQRRAAQDTARDLFLEQKTTRLNLDMAQQKCNELGGMVEREKQKRRTAQAMLRKMQMRGGIWAVVFFGLAVWSAEAWASGSVPFLVPLAMAAGMVSNIMSGGIAP